MRTGGDDHDDDKHDGGSDRADQLYRSDDAAANSEQKGCGVLKPSLLRKSCSIRVSHGASKKRSKNRGFTGI